MKDTIAAAALSRAVDWVRNQIRKDRENRYSLLRDWQLPAAFWSAWPDDVGAWECDLLRVERVAAGVVRVTVKAYHSTASDNICDGATLSPDNIPGILPAALFHDPWYYRASKDAPKTFEALADALHIKRRAARKFGDALFYSIARAGGCSWLTARLYYLGIRIGYPLVKPFIAAALCALLAGGCALGGCSTDGSFVNPGDFTPPQWEKVN